MFYRILVYFQLGPPDVHNSFSQCYTLTPSITQREPDPEFKITMYLYSILMDVYMSPGFGHDLNLYKSLKSREIKKK